MAEAGHRTMSMEMLSAADKERACSSPPSLLGRSPDEKAPGAAGMVLVQEDSAPLAGRPPPAEGRQIKVYLFEVFRQASASADHVQVVVAHTQICVSFSQPSNHHEQPASKEPGSDHTFFGQLQGSGIEAASILGQDLVGQCQGREHGGHRVLMVGSELVGQQGECFAGCAALESGYRYPFLSIGKQLDNPSMIRGN